MKKPKIDYNIIMESVSSEQEHADRLIEQMMIAFASSQCFEAEYEIRDEARSFIKACQIFNEVLREETEKKNKKQKRK